MQFSKSNFSEWFTDVLSEAGIMDIRYPVKGMPVYMPWGFAILRKIFSYLEGQLEDAGHEQALFPLLLTDNLLAKESHMLEGFSPEVFWVDAEDDGRKLAIRPTSETIMYTMYSLWVQSYKDLPLRIHQTVTCYRQETKATRPLIRGREFYWNEAHTVHATREDAEKQIAAGVDIYSKVYNMLGISFLPFVRPEFDKFPGAEYSIAFDTLLPDGKSLQIATVHYLGTNFSKPYAILYKNEKNERVPAYQTCYGISMRALAAVVAVHGDDSGLVLPSKSAPIQIIIIPFTKSPEIGEIEFKLKSFGYRCRVDDSGRRAGDKFYHWEAKGVPMRIEVGERELKGNSVKIAMRNGEKQVVKISELDKIGSLFEKYDKSLGEAHADFIEKNTYSAGSLSEIKKGGFVKFGWCGDDECAGKVKEQGVEIRGEIYGKKPVKLKCIACGKDGKEVYAVHPY